MEYKTTVLHLGNCTARVHDPIRTPEQQKKRQRDLEDACAEFMRAVYEQRGKKNEDKETKAI